MKALRINTETRKIEHIELGDWKTIAPAIGNGCTMFTCPIEFENMDTIYCDDEGLFNDFKGGFIMKDWMYPLVGNSILIGGDGEGNSVDVKTTAEELEKMVIWVSKENCDIWADKYR